MNVEDSDAVPGVPPGAPAVERDCSSAEHRRRRQKAVSFARASLELEGFAIGAEVEQDAARFVDGEISIDEFVRRAKTLSSR